MLVLLENQVNKLFHPQLSLETNNQLNLRKMLLSQTHIHMRLKILKKTIMLLIQKMAIMMIIQPLSLLSKLERMIMNLTNQ